MKCILEFLFETVMKVAMCLNLFFKTVPNESIICTHYGSGTTIFQKS